MVTKEAVSKNWQSNYSTFAINQYFGRAVDLEKMDKVAIVHLLSNNILRLETCNFTKKYLQIVISRFCRTGFLKLFIVEQLHCRTAFLWKSIFLSNTMVTFVQISANHYQKNLKSLTKNNSSKFWSKSTVRHFSLVISVWIALIYLSFLKVFVYWILLEHS